MIIKQVTVAVENREGKLKEIMDVLGSHNINVLALSMADTVLRLIVADPAETMELLLESGYEAELTDVIRVKVPSRAGALADMLVNLAAEHIYIDYMYAFATGSGDDMIIHTSKVERTTELLADWEL